MALRLARRKSPAFFTACIGRAGATLNLQLAAPARNCAAGGRKLRDVSGLRGCYFLDCRIRRWTMKATMSPAAMAPKMSGVAMTE